VLDDKQGDEFIEGLRAKSTKRIDVNDIRYEGKPGRQLISALARACVRVCVCIQ